LEITKSSTLYQSKITLQGDILNHENAQKPTYDLAEKIVKETRELLKLKTDMLKDIEV